VGDSFKDDIEKAERMTLVVSWIGVVASLGIIMFSIWGV
tara:strand:- start:637 stop:753 length:117 start_codon:yes stop_codon:yes gene_type:complete